MPNLVNYQMELAVAVFIFILLFVLFRAFGGTSRRQPQAHGRLSEVNAKPTLPVAVPRAPCVAAVPRDAAGAANASPGVWVPPGSQVEIHGYKINDGMIYLGSHLNLVSGHGIEPALIDPNLQVSEPPEQYIGMEIPYWPSYSNLPPQARGLYLRWLARGRKDPAVSIGVVFLFFYGLERRLITEREAITSAEGLLLLGELDRSCLSGCFS
jgi:TerB-like protein